VRLDKREADPRFYYYFFASPLGRSVVSTIVSGTNVKGIRGTELRELEVPLPTKAEQEAIAEALNDTDALIESLEQLLAKKHHIKQGALQELLTGKRRLPGFSRGQQTYRSTKFGLMPADWGPKSLERVAAFITKGSTPTTYGFAWQNEGVLFLRSECVAEGGLDLSQSMFISAKADSDHIET
jgi:type I restriction enzyme S subunit